MSYEVSLPIFEGPLDLLLYLLRKNEVDIYDIPIAEITRQYLDALELMRGRGALDLDASGEFLTMAATLLRIKSRMLLPRSEEEGEEEDPRRDLVLQLVEYRKFKEAARKMAVMEEKQRLLFNRPLIPVDGGEGSEDLAPRGDVADLVAALQSLLARIQDDRLYEIIGEDVSVEERMEHVLRVLAERGGTGELRFEELFAGARRRLVLIATFMAILELARQTRLAIRQEALFGEIWVRRQNAA